MLTHDEVFILENRLPEHMFDLVMRSFEVLSKYDYDKHNVELARIVDNEDTLRYSISKDILLLLTSSAVELSKEIGVVFSDDASLNMKITALDSLFLLRDTDFDLRIKLIEDLDNKDDTIEQMVLLVSELGSFNHYDTYVDFDDVTPELIDDIKYLLSRETIDDDVGLMRYIYRKNILNRIVKETITTTDTHLKIISALEHTSLDTSISVLLDMHSGELQSTVTDNVIASIICIIAYSKEGRVNPIDTYLNTILPLLDNDLVLKIQDRFLSTFDTLVQKLKLEGFTHG